MIRHGSIASAVSGRLMLSGLLIHVYWGFSQTS
jgi:hypothetical protein